MATQQAGLKLGNRGQYCKTDKHGSRAFSIPVNLDELRNKVLDNMTMTLIGEDTAVIASEKVLDNMTMTLIGEDTAVIASEKIKPEFVRGDVKPVFNIPCHVLSKKSEVKAEMIVKESDKVVKILPLTLRFQPNHVEIEARDANSNQDLVSSTTITEKNRLREVEEKVNSLTQKMAEVEEKLARCHCNKPFPLQGKEVLYSDGEMEKAPVINPSGD